MSHFEKLEDICVAQNQRCSINHFCLIVLLYFSSSVIKKYFDIEYRVNKLTHELNSFISNVFGRRRKFFNSRSTTISDRKQYNKASLKAIIYENLIHFLHVEEFLQKKRKKTFNKFRNAFAGTKIMQNFSSILRSKLALWLHVGNSLLLLNFCQVNL